MTSETDKKPQTPKPSDGTGLALGAAFGVAFGALFGQLAMSLALGTAFGAAIDVISHMKYKNQQ